MNPCAKNQNKNNESNEVRMSEQRDKGGFIGSPDRSKNKCTW